MKKILIAFDGLNYKASAAQFAISLSAHLHGHLTGLFLNDSTYHSFKIYDVDNGRLLSEKEVEAGAKEDSLLREKSVRLFEEECQLHRLAHKVRTSKNIALPELVHESIYADVLVLNAGEKFTHYPENRPSGFVRELLELTQCPVILAPDVTDAVNKAVLLYDGSPAAMYAIKMFCYLMSGHNQLTVEVLSVKKENETLHLKDNKLVKEYIRKHFPNATFTVVKGNGKLKIIAALKKEKPGTIVVLGAYKRGIVSRWFKPSMADILLSTLKLPLFIAHGQ
jgi:nucleotide-binding universal stress UspA family protein